MRRQMVLAVAMMLSTGLMWAQTAKGTKEIYGPEAEARPVTSESRLRLVLTVRELDERGKVLNIREYAALVGARPASEGNGYAQIRTGAKIPVTTGSASAVQVGVSTQFTYVDVGVNFDVRGIQWISPNRIRLNIDADVSSFDQALQGGHPIIRDNKWSGSEQMNIGEQKELFSSDDLTSKNRVQVSLSVRSGE